MKSTIGIKQSMSQRFLSDGRVAPVTSFVLPLCTVTQIKTKDHDGYSAVQLGALPLRTPAKTLQGKQFKYLKEFRVNEELTSGITLGQLMQDITFKAGDTVTVASISKGKGFAGVVKRHHFRGHPTTHGHKDQARASGSIGHGVQHVVKGTRMAGRMGNAQVTVKHLKVIEVNPATREILVKGSVAGPRNALVFIHLDKQAS